LKSLLTDILKLLKEHRRLLMRLAAVAVVVGAIVSGAGFYFSSQPWFCNSCHYMKPYVANWKTSSHADVACPTCHFSKNPLVLMKQKTHAMATTIRYVVGTYDRRPRAEVEDKACLQSGCHETRLLSGKATYKRGIVFDHEDHLGGERRGIELRCTTCHSQLVQGDHISVTESVCFTCHFLNTPEGHPLGGCGNCHGAPSQTVTHKGFTLDHAKYISQGVECEKCHIHVTRGTGEVPETRCYDCHMEKDRHKYDKETIHHTHVTEHKVECFECHAEIRHGLVEITESLDATCGQCHKQQRDLFAGKGASLVPESPDTMFLAKVSCEGCHHKTLASHDGAKVVLPEMKQACVDCHGKGYGVMLEKWLAVSEDGLKTANSLLAGVENALARASGIAIENKAKIEKTIANARSDLNMLEKSGPAHNMIYALDIIDAAQRSLREAAASLPGDTKPLMVAYRPISAKSDIITSCIKSCHIGLRRNTTVSYEDVQFPHERHLGKENIECKTCHSNEPEHGKLTVKKADCSSCHHDGADDCSGCHQLQNNMLAGKGGALPTRVNKAAAMSDGVPCEACHTEIEANQPPRAVAAACDECHDKGTGKAMISLWQGTTRKLHKSSLKILADLEKAQGNAPHAQAAPAMRAARAKLRAIEQDGSWGVHNPAMAELLLKEADNLLDAAEQQIGSRISGTQGDNK